MEILSYLHDNYLTKERLLDGAGLDESDLREYQNADVMPKPSYRLRVQVTGDSYLGEISQTSEVEYYPEGYVSWLILLKELANQNDAFQIFCDRYRDAVAKLIGSGFQPESESFSSKLNVHIEAEWEHFLNGTYGLCTRTGLPEEIAKKELLTSLVSEITVDLEKNELTSQEAELIQRAIDMLDEAVSQFAPHERPASSREKYINQVTLTYGLKEQRNAQ